MLVRIADKHAIRLEEFYDEEEETEEEENPLIYR